LAFPRQALAVKRGPGRNAEIHGRGEMFCRQAHKSASAGYIAEI